jgi:FtsZ-binding cell division protein ZapB
MQLRYPRRVLPTLREYEQEIEKLRTLNGNLRSDYEKLRANNEKLGREYAELWREHQQICDILGPLLPED